jgi:hypothetical protein
MADDTRSFSLGLVNEFYLVQFAMTVILFSFVQYIQGLGE